MPAEEVLREVWEQAFTTGDSEHVGLPVGAWELIEAYAAEHGWKREE